MTREQMAAFLAAVEPRHYALFLTMARTGMRISEVIGLEWGDIDIAGREITIARAVSRGAVGAPKSGHSRRVDMSEQLAAALMAVRPASPAGPVFTVGGARISEDWIRGALARGLKAAGLPHFSPHAFRHSYASQMLQASESPAYVQRQLGHASISLTVDTYGSWLPSSNRAAANRLDDNADVKRARIEAEVTAVVNGLKV
jgi:integrase